MPDTPLCGLPHHTWPETLCTQPAGHYRPEVDPHAGPLIINGRERGGCAWDEPDAPSSVGPAAETPNEPAAPVATPASGLRDTLATWLRHHALNDLEDPAAIDSLTTTVIQATPAAFPTVQGHCPACGGTSLFLGSGGYITCARIECPEPDAASTLLEHDPRRATEPPTGPRSWAETVDSTDGGKTIRIPGYGPDGSETDGITVDRANARILRDMLGSLIAEGTCTCGTSPDPGGCGFALQPGGHCRCACTALAGPAGDTNGDQP